MLAVGYDLSMVEVLDDVYEEFQPLPEIYAIELTAACDLRCPMCLRTTEGNRKPKLFPVDFLKTMHARGDFGGSTFIELQQAGEPTIHPRLLDVVNYLRDDVGLMTGLSTHGLNLHKANVAAACMGLDALTISIDSLDPEIYHKMRYPAHVEDLKRCVSCFMNSLETVAKWLRPEAVPFVEFQLVKTPLVSGSGDIKALRDWIVAEGWEKYVRIRTNRDAFMEMDGRAIAGTMPRPRNQICLNPFTSVNINQDGDVTSCCMIFNPTRESPNWYGNIFEQSLAEIWNGDRVRTMRLQHRVGMAGNPASLPGQCGKCYTWSPVQIHQNIVRGIVRAR